MTKPVKWITLTPEERRLVEPMFSRSFSCPGSGRNGDSGNSSLVKQHTCEVQLPDRTACHVTYQHENGQYHKFSFAEPLCQRLYVHEPLTGSVEAVEAKAQELAAKAYKQAQEAEQKAMQKSTPPPGQRIAVPASIPLLRPKTAQAQAGQYTVCVAFASGNLMPVGRLLHTSAEAAAREWEQTVQQRVTRQATPPLVVGICCRWQKRWTRAQFVIYPPLPEEPEREPEAQAAPKKRDRSRRVKAAGAADVPAPPEETPFLPPPPPTPPKARGGRKGAQPPAGEPPR